MKTSTLVSIALVLIGFAAGSVYATVVGHILRAGQ